jgi:acylphosphatase
MSFSFLHSFDRNIKAAKAYDKIAYDLGEALALLNKQAAIRSNTLSGELYAAADGSILLDVPNSFIRGSFDALSETGITLPGKDGKFHGHIVVMTPEEVRGLKGVKSVSERGHRFNYNIGALHEAPVTNSLHHGKVWFFSVASQDLSKLRKSYGLSPAPGKHGFHIVVALRKIGVLGNNNISKSAASYVATGNVQGVGLRATLHDILNKNKLPGLAVNNPHTGDVEIDLPLDDTKADEVINNLRKLLDSGEAGKDNYQINKIEKANKLLDILMDDKMVERFAKRQGFTQLGAEPHEYKKDWLVKRYRLGREGSNLVGKVSPMAHRQLRGLEPVYSVEAHLADGGSVPSSPWVDKARAKYKLLNMVSKPDKQTNLIQDNSPDVETKSDTPLGNNTTPMLGGEQ